MANFFKVLRNICLCLVLLSISIIWILSLQYTTSTDIKGFTEAVEIVRQDPIVRLMLGLAAAALVAAVINVFQHISVIAAGIISAVSLSSVTLSGYLLARWNPYPPNADQYLVWYAARYITGYDSSMPYPYARNYWLKLPRQKAMSYLMSIFIKIVHSGSEYYFRLANVILLMACIIGVSVIAYLLTNDKKLSFFTCFVSSAFVPIVFYVNYIYSTIPSLAAVVWAFVILIIAQRYKRRNARYCALLLLSAILLIFANIFYMASVIASIAAVLYLLYEEIYRDRNYNSLITKAAVFAMALVVYFGSMLSSQWLIRAFENKTETPAHEGIPAIGWIYMGITSEDGVNGPGSYNGIDELIFADHDYNTSESAAAFREGIYTAVNEYFNGTRDISFFKDKSIIQWCDPWFSSITMTFYPDLLEEGENNSHYQALIDSGWLGMIQTIFSFYISTVYLGVIFLVVNKIRTFHSNRSQSTLPEGSILLMIYVLGGIIFQVFWESKSRYCLPYFFLMIPLAVNGFRELTHVISHVLPGLLLGIHKQQ